MSKKPDQSDSSHSQTPNQGRAYQRAKTLMSAVLQSPKKLLVLVGQVQTKAGKLANDKFAELMEPLATSYRLVRAYAQGHYKDISMESLGLMVAALIYFVMPIDSLPDFIAIFGLTDDAAILAWTFQRLKQELERFRLWESNHESAEPPNHDSQESDQSHQ